MKSAFLAAIAVLSILEPAAARTVEELATKLGKLAGNYARATFLCKANGIEMPNLANLNPDQAAAMLDMNKRYPDYFAYGFEQGQKDANEFLANNRELPKGCAEIKAIFIPSKK